MAHFGVLSYKGSGHLNPLIALSRKLVTRGHRVTFFLQPLLEQRIRQHELEFYPIDIPHKTPQNKSKTQLGQIQAAIRHIDNEMEGYLRAYPVAIHTAGVDTLIMGEISLTGPTVAEMLRLPYFIVSTSIPHNFGWDAPRSVVNPGSWLDRLQRHVLEVSILRMKGPVQRRLDRHRRRLGLQSIRTIDRVHPELAHITQWPQCLDAYRPVLSNNFCYTGPFIDEAARDLIPFPWDRLDGRPLVYASLGTTRKADPSIFTRIAEACSQLNLQLAISLGGRRDIADFTNLSGDPILIGNAPQVELIKRSQIVLTHAGPNTVLESLMQGKPMVALPMTLDQPAIAARLLTLGVAEVLPMNHRSTKDIRAGIEKVLYDPKYQRTAEALQMKMQSVCGLDLAADSIEERLRVSPADLPAIDVVTIP
jgi:zeaxanthin glucosyltransferase